MSDVMMQRQAVVTNTPIIPIFDFLDHEKHAQSYNYKLTSFPHLTFFYHEKHAQKGIQ
jgi:hypothetical protein